MPGLGSFLRIEALFEWGKNLGFFQVVYYFCIAVSVILIVVSEFHDAPLVNSSNVILMMLFFELLNANMVDHEKMK